MSEKETAVKDSKLSKICGNTAGVGHWVILIFSLLIFVLLCVQSMLYTTVMRNEKGDPSAIYYYYDNMFINIAAVVIVFLCSVFFLRKLMTKINPKIFGTILLVYVLVIGIVWNVLTKCMPAHDSWYVEKAAIAAANGDYSRFEFTDKEFNYFYFYPFQLGYTLLFEIASFIFGENAYFVLQIMNVLSVVAVYAAILIIVKLAFVKREVINLTALLLFGCLPPIFFSTFHYGNLTGFGFSMWAVVFTCLWIKKRKVVFIPLAAVFIGIGAALKSNSLIILVAICILLLLDLLKNRQWRSMAAIIMTAALGICFNSLVITSYELRADVNFGSGIPKILWLDMGLNESGNPNRPGWYAADYTVLRFINADMDPDVAVEEGLKDIGKRIDAFVEDPSYCREFFWVKTMSQWNDPMYMSIWICSTRTKAPNDFVESMYSGSYGIITEEYANIYQAIVFVFALSGVIYIIMRKDKRQNIFCIALPLIILGGFLYHLLFEAMPQYNLIYFILFVPLAAYGLYELSSCCEKLIQKKKNIGGNEEK